MPSVVSYDYSLLSYRLTLVLEPDVQIFSALTAVALMDGIVDKFGSTIFVPAT